MANELKIFENKEFGKVRTIMLDSEPWLVGKDVAGCLGYSNVRDAIAKHVDEEDKRNLLKSQNATLENFIPKDVFPVEFSKIDIPNRGLTVINESSVYSLVFGSKLPKAKAFKRWVTSEVLPAIRKTGSYSRKSDDSLQSKRLDIMEFNARSRAANLLLKIAERTSIKEYKEVCNAKAAAMVTGEDLLPMPTAERRTYSAKEIGKMFGVSANRIGKVANAHKLKTPEYGKLFYSKSEHSVKEVETWRYYETAIPVFADIFGVKVVAV